MEIKPNRFDQSAFPVTGGARTKATGATSSPTSFEGSNSLNAALAAAPDVRSEAVRRGEALVSSPTYPSKAIMHKVANLLAARLTGPEE